MHAACENSVKMKRLVQCYSWKLIYSSISHVPISQSCNRQRRLTDSVYQQDYGNTVLCFL